MAISDGGGKSGLRDDAWSGFGPIVPQTFGIPTLSILLVGINFHASVVA